jgi:NitT/TauT family transport system substrate-binding protein
LEEKLNMKNHKQLLIVWTVVMVLSLVLSACAPTTPAVSTEPTAVPKAVISLIYHPTIGGSTAIAIAEAHGMFEEENLEIRYQRFTSGPPEIAAIVAGRADVGFIGSGAAWLAFRGDVNIIALDNLAMTDEVVAKKSSGINTLEDLRGKTVATQLGTAGENILNLALAKAGLTRDDINLVNMDNNNLASAILSTGGESVDVIAGWQPGTTAVMSALGEDGILLASNKDFPEAAFPSTWVANKAWLQNNPDVAQRFVNALTKAQAYRAENMQEACEWASERAGQPANDLYAQIPFALWPTGPQLKDYYHNGGFEEMLVNLRSNQIAGGRISEAEVRDMSEVLVDSFAKNATEGY